MTLEITSPDLYFFIQHTETSFEKAVELLKTSGVLPIPADNLDIAYQHCLTFCGDPKDFRKDYPENSQDSIVAIKVTPEVLHAFGKGSIQRYGEAGKALYIRMLSREDVFVVTECEFIEI